MPGLKRILVLGSEHQCLLTSHPFIQRCNPSPKSFHDFANTPDLIKFRFELVNLAQDRLEPSDFSICHLNSIAGSIMLKLGGVLSL